MAASWQEQFFEKLVEAAHGAGDPRLATAKLHRRKKTASFQHRQLRKVECRFDTIRTDGSQETPVLLIECRPKRGTDIDGPALEREFAKAGIAGSVQIEPDGLEFQYRWGIGHDTPFPVHDPRRVAEVAGWVISVLRVLIEHMERRMQIATPTIASSGSAATPLDLQVALEAYLEELLITSWDDLAWAAELEFLGRQVDCGTLGRIDILAREQGGGNFVVVELKRDQGDDEVIGQLSRYMGWIAENRAAPKAVAVRGIVVAHEITDRLRAATLPHATISLYTYRFSLAVAPVALNRIIPES